MGELAVSNQETNAVMSMIERVALDPNSDLAKLEKMLGMQERVLNRNAQQAFSADMAMMQAKLPRVIKTRSAHNSKYAPLEDINDAIRPTLQEFGFAVTFGIEQSEKNIKVITHLSHRQGHREETSILLPADTSGSKNAVQAVGSTISYGKRYGICAILNISTGDDVDGNIPQSNDIDVTDFVILISEADSLESLKAVYTDAYNHAKSSKKALQEITKAKESRKKELSK
jgi:hypothetical protein